jgi:hypothetical protein
MWLHVSDYEERPETWDLVRRGRWRPQEPYVALRPRLILLGLRSLLSLTLMLAVLLSSGILMPHWSAQPLTRIAWQHLLPKVDSVGLGENLTGVQHSLGAPPRIFRRGDLEVLSYGSDYDPGRFELSSTTVGLDRCGRSVRISGQTLHFSHLPDLAVGMTRSQISQILGEPTETRGPCGQEDCHVYWHYCTAGTILSVAFDAETGRVVRYILAD